MINTTWFVIGRNRAATAQPTVVRAINPTAVRARLVLVLNSGRAANTSPSAQRGPKRSTAESGRTHTVHSLIPADDAGVRSGHGHIDRRRETSQQRYAGIGEFLRPNSSKNSGRSELPPAARRAR